MSEVFYTVAWEQGDDGGMWGSSTTSDPAT